MCAIGTNTLYNIFHISHCKTRRKRDDRYLTVGDAIGATTTSACEMHMIDMMIAVAMTHTVFAYPRAVINIVEQMTLREETKRAENARPIEIGHQFLYI